MPDGCALAVKPAPWDAPLPNAPNPPVGVDGAAGPFVPAPKLPKPPTPPFALVGAPKVKEAGAAPVGAGVEAALNAPALIPAPNRPVEDEVDGLAPNLKPPGDAPGAAPKEGAADVSIEGAPNEPLEAEAPGCEGPALEAAVLLLGAPKLKTGCEGFELVGALPKGAELVFDWLTGAKLKPPEAAVAGGAFEEALLVALSNENPDAAAPDAGVEEVDAAPKLKVGALPDGASAGFEAAVVAEGAPKPAKLKGAAALVSDAEGGTVPEEVVWPPVPKEKVDAAEAARAGSLLVGSCAGPLLLFSCTPSPSASSPRLLLTPAITVWPKPKGLVVGASLRLLVWSGLLAEVRDDVEAVVEPSPFGCVKPVAAPVRLGA